MAKKKFYAVRKGRKPGIYDTWRECSKQVQKVRGAVYKGFATREEAEAFMHGISFSASENVNPEMYKIPVAVMEDRIHKASDAIAETVCGIHSKEDIYNRCISVMEDVFKISLSDKTGKANIPESSFVEDITAQILNNR